MTNHAADASTYYKNKSTNNAVKRLRRYDNNIDNL